MPVVKTTTLAGEICEWKLRKGATVQDLQKKIRITCLDKKRCGLVVLETRHQLRRHEVLDGLLDGIDYVLLVWADDADTVLKRFREAMIRKVESAARMGYEEVQKLYTSAKSIKMTLEFALRTAFALHRRECAGKEDILRQFQEDLREDIDAGLGEPLARINDEPLRSNLEDALIELESWLMLYMAANEHIIIDEFDFFKKELNEAFDASIR